MKPAWIVGLVFAAVTGLAEDRQAPLRAFLAFVFLYAGISKVADSRFLDSDSPISIHSTLVGVRSASPIGGLLD